VRATKTTQRLLFVYKHLALGITDTATIYRKITTTPVNQQLPHIACSTRTISAYRQRLLDVALVNALIQGVLGIGVGSVTGSGSQSLPNRATDKPEY
jgi:hypothetical protein